MILALLPETGAGSTERQTYGKLPVLKSIGVVPTVWEGGRGGDETPRSKIVEAALEKSLGDSKRFRIVNSEITSELWSSPDGRKELVDEYEVNALVSLVVYHDGDSLTLVLRLLNLEMENYLVESDRIGRGWFLRSLDEELAERVENLVFRLINRIPVDVSVTSVEARYVTVSGGVNQGVLVGDELTFYRTTITAVHPVNGSWMAFDQKRLGKARVIEAKEYSALAEITWLGFEDAIEVGDGAAVAAIRSRTKFKRLSDRPELKDSGSGPPLLALPATGAMGKRKAVLPRQKPQPAAAISAGPLIAQASSDVPLEIDSGAEGGKAVVASPEGVAPAAPLPEGEAMGVLEPVTPVPADRQPATGDPVNEVQGPPSDTERSAPPAIISEIGRHVSGLWLVGGLRSWSVSGSVAAKSSTPLLILNHFGAGGERELAPGLGAEVFGAFEYGPTGRGDFSGMIVRGAGLYDVYKHPGLLARIRLGALVSYESFGVEKERFGGGNIIKFGPEAIANGTFKIPQVPIDLDYKASLRYFVYASGSFGVRGRDRAIASVGGYELRGELYEKQAKRALEMGGFLAVESNDYTLDRGSISLTGSTLGVMARYRF